MIEFRQVNKWFGSLHVLNDINLAIKQGEVVVVCGPSGSGKSTLIRCINKLEPIQKGEIIVDGQSLNDPKTDINKLRAEVGMVFQQFNLFPHLTVLRNITLAQIKVRKRSKEEAERIACNLLEKVGIPEKADNYPFQLSGGQQQSVAIARALANDPPLVAADEPTGNLDSKTAETVFRLFERLVDDGKTILVVTHDSDLAKRTDRIVVLADGEIMDGAMANH